MATGAGTNVGMLTIQRTAGQAAVDNQDRVRIFSWLGVAPSFSNVIGPVAAGLMIDAAGFRAAYGLLLLLPLATLFTARLVPHLPPAGVLPAPGRKTWDLLRAPGLKRLLVVNWLLSMCWDVHTFAVPILGHERGFSASTIGLILGTFTLSVTAIRMPSRWRTACNRCWCCAARCWARRWSLCCTRWRPTPWLMGACAVLLGSRWAACSRW
jgi:MFS family permease